MKSNKKSLRNNILIYLIIFSIIILTFLWFFQIVSLNSYYKIDKTKNIESTINDLILNYKKNNYKEVYDKLSEKNEICINLIIDNNIIYSSAHQKQCINESNEKYKQSIINFINQNKQTYTTELINPDYNNKTLIYGKKIDENTYVIANTSLEPLDYSISLLKKQFIYVALSVLVLSIIISTFISNKISKPITNLNQIAKKLQQKNYDITFDNKTSIIEINELANTLNETTKELSKTEAVRKEFLANISHDLKTPLTMIKAYAESARDLNSNKKLKREGDLNIIIEETERLNILVNDILELSKIEAKTTELELTEFNITELIKTIIKRYDIYEQEKYKFIFNEQEDYIITADKKRIEQVLYNLINNAINYTGIDKKIIINYEILPKNKLKINISDTGKGISEEDINLIWNKYYKTNKTHQRNAIGTGLGLSIVKTILENHNLKYGVTTSKNKGTTFYFIIETKNEQ